MRESEILRNIVRLRIMLHEMEQSLGFESLSSVERDALYAACELHQKAGGEISSDQIASSDLMCGVPEATFYRAMRKLVKSGFLSLAPGRKRGLYVLDIEHCGRNVAGNPSTRS